MSLPVLFGTTGDTVPAEVPYIRPDALEVVCVGRADRRPGAEGRPGVGRTAAASERPQPVLPVGDVPAAGPDSGRPALLAAEGPGRVPDREFRAAGRDRPPGARPPRLLGHRRGAVAPGPARVGRHLGGTPGGAMARPVWVLLPNIPDWRWMLDREDSPWYPTMRLFRQTGISKRGARSPTKWRPSCPAADEGAAVPVRAPVADRQGHAPTV